MESKYNERLLAYMTGDHIYIDTENRRDGTFSYCAYPATRCIRGGCWLDLVDAVVDPGSNREYPIELTVIEKGHTDDCAYKMRVKYMDAGKWRKRNGIGVEEVSQ